MWGRGPIALLATNATKESEKRTSKTKKRGRRGGGEESTKDAKCKRLARAGAAKKLQKKKKKTWNETACLSNAKAKQKKPLPQRKNTSAKNRPQKQHPKHPAAQF